ncbi:N/A [soil metagenome]
MVIKSYPVSILEDTTASLILNSLRLVPKRIKYWGVLIIVRAWSLIAVRQRRVGAQNLKLAFPELNGTKRRAILKGEFESLTRTIKSLDDLATITRENYTDFIEQTSDKEFLSQYKRIQDSGRGRIIIGAHLGNWEMLAFTYPMLFEPLHFISRHLDNPLLHERLTRIRTRLGNVQIDKRKSAVTILRILKKGGAVGMLSDVNAVDAEGVFVPFFGMLASTNKGPAMLALRADVPLIPIFSVWDKRIGKYVVVHGRVIEPISTGDVEDDVRLLTAEYTAEIESCIRKYPDQWLWIHRRWKNRPPGETDIYAR